MFYPEPLNPFILIIQTFLGEVDSRLLNERVECHSFFSMYLRNKISFFDISESSTMTQLY